MNKLRVGDVVRISDVGRQEYPNSQRNPYHLTGIVTDTEAYSDHGYHTSDHGYHTTVTWSNDEWNSYRDGELELVKESEQRRRKGYGQWLRALESSGVR